VLVAGTTYRTLDGELREMAVRRVELPRPTTVERLSRHYDDPGSGPPPNIAFVVVDSPAEKPGAAQVCAVLFDHFNPSVAPWPIWSTNLLVEPATHEAFVVVARSLLAEVTLTLCRVDRTRQMGPPPLGQDFLERKTLPAPAPVLAVIRKRFEEVDPCAVAEVRIVPERRHLLLYLQRGRDDCDPLLFRVDRETGRATEVTLEEKPVEAVTN
jgi:hypothetical protein